MAPQLTATNSPAARGLRSWMARATSSLPTPLSPETSTVVRDGATRSMSEKSSRIGALFPIIPPLRVRSASFFRSETFSRTSARFSSALPTTTSISSTLNGLIT